MAYPPALTPYPDAHPCPRVEFSFASLNPATAFVTVWRQADGRKYRVRGAVNASASGAFSRIDTEVPFNTDVTYWAEMFDANHVSLGLTDTGLCKVWSDDTWVQNPLDPANAVRVRFASSAARSISRPVTGSVYYPQNRRVGVVISSQRQGISGVQLDVIVTSLEEADKFTNMVGDYENSASPVLCFRKGSMDQIRLPSPFFAAVLDATEVDISYRFGGEDFVYEMEGDEVAPPAEGIVVPLLTRADIAAYYASRSAKAADNSSRFAVSRRYDLAGTA